MKLDLRGVYVAEHSAGCQGLLGWLHRRPHKYFSPFERISQRAFPKGPDGTCIATLRFAIILSGEVPVYGLGARM